MEAEYNVMIPNYDPYAGVEGEYYYDPVKAQVVIDFFQTCLVFVKGEKSRQPFMLEPWQESILRTIFGWYSVDTGLRRYSHVFLYIPRKNGKTTLGAGIPLFLLNTVQEDGLEIFSAAKDRKQASIMFKIAEEMVLKNPDLMSRHVINQNLISRKDPIHGGRTNSFYTAICAEAGGQHGLDVYAAVIDELHNQPNRELVDVIETGTAARKEALILYVTTADVYGESICNEKLKYAKDVQEDPLFDKHFLPIIYETTKDDDWECEEVWKKANPNWGVSVVPDYIRAEYKRAKSTPSRENTFKRLHLNMQTEMAERWLQMSDWNGCPQEALLTDGHCFGGLDLASSDDFCAFILYFPKRNEVLPFFWIPEDNERNHREPYASWIREGLVMTTPGNVTDHSFIEKTVVNLSKQYNIVNIGVDTFSALQLALTLSDTHGIEITEFRQGFLAFNEPCLHLEALIKSRVLNHGHNRVLRWMAGNVAIRRDPDDHIRPSKKHSNDKIDGIVSLLMAIGVYLFEEGGGTSKYEKEELTVMEI